MAINKVSTLESKIPSILGVIASISSDLEDAESMITALQAAVGAPLKAATVSEMTDTNKVYVYTGSETGYTAGNWYYYNGSSWVSGGVYNSTAVETDKTLSLPDVPADAQKVGELMAPKESPTFTGDPEAPTQESTDNSTKLATTEFVQNAFNSERAELIAGTALQLLGEKYVEEQAPYHFRQTGGGIDGAVNRLSEEIVGATVVWNQLLQTFTSSNWSSETGVGSTTYGTSYVLFKSTTNDRGVYSSFGSLSAGDVVLLTYDSKIENYSGSEELKISIGNGSNDISIIHALSTAFDRHYAIVKLDAAPSNSNIYFRAHGSSALSKNIRIQKANFHNLTTMFDSIVADSIYTVEQANAGDGIKRFYNLFPVRNYSYDAGSFKHVYVDHRETVGLNQWDEDYRTDGYYDSSGTFVSGPYLSSRNAIPVIPNTEYYINNSAFGGITFWDYDLNFISRYNSRTQKFTTPSNCAYIHFNMNYGYGIFYKNNICINISNDECNGLYRQYVKHTYPLDNSVRLRGKFKLDSNSHDLYADGDVYHSDGTIQRKYKQVSNLVYADDITIESNEGRFIIDTDLFPGIAIHAYIVSKEWKCVRSGLPADMPDKTIYAYNSSSNILIYCNDSAMAGKTAAQIATALNNTVFVYELDTPTTDEAAPFDNVQIVENYGTERYVNANYMAAGHKSKYYSDLKGKIENAPNNPESDGTYVVSHEEGTNTYVPFSFGGTYNDMTVGSANQLISKGYEEDNAPYTLRTAGGSADVADRMQDIIVGGSVVWNQLASNGDFADGLSGWNTSLERASLSVSNKICTITVTQNPVAVSSIRLARYSGFSLKKGHIYIFTVESKAEKEYSLYFSGNETTYPESPADVWNKHYGFISRTSDGSAYCYWGISNYSDFVIDDSVQFRNYVAHDITVMFGKTIADYIYSLEQANAGDGFAWFKRLYPKVYYDFNSGEMTSIVGLSAHAMVGFNQWNERWEPGSISDTTGGNVSQSNTIRSKYHIPILPDTAYFFNRGSYSGTMFTFYYDADKAYLGYSDGNINITENSVITTPANAYYMRFYVNNATTYSHDICINIHDSERDGEYEPYTYHSYPLDSMLTLRGKLRLDSNNQLYYDGDKYYPDGTVKRRYKMVTLSGVAAADVNIGTGVGRIRIDPGFFPGISYHANIVSEEWECVRSGEITNMPDKTIYADNTSSEIWICVYDTSFASKTAAEVATALNGRTFVYELAEPITEQARPFTENQIIDRFGIETYTFTDGSFAMPVGHESKYTVDLRGKLEIAPNSPEDDGVYMMKQEDGINSYTPAVGNIVATGDGTVSLTLSFSPAT